jgi:hypothetical protein
LFSAFTKPFDNNQFKLLHDPVSANIVNNPAEWSTGGGTFGACSGINEQLACKIFIDETKTSYFHTVGTDKILNTFAYADAQTPDKVDYVVITEIVSGTGSDRIITGISAFHWNGFSYVSAYPGFSFVNGQENNP